MIDYCGINIGWLGHSGFKISYENKNIYIDPYKLDTIYEGINDADLIFITHDHFDHLSIEDLNKIINENTIVVTANECVSQLKSLKLKEIIPVKPNRKNSVLDIKFETIPAYNIDKDFHPMKDNKVGFILTVKNIRIYHTGDSDVIPEMKTIKADVVLMPVSGKYVMTSEEAAQAINDFIKPKMVIPMHYGTIIGTKDDAIRFQKLVTVCTTKILEKE